MEISGLDDGDRVSPKRTENVSSPAAARAFKTSTKLSYLCSSWSEAVGSFMIPDCRPDKKQRVLQRSWERSQQSKLQYRDLNSQGLGHSLTCFCFTCLSRGPKPGQPYPLRPVCRRIDRCLGTQQEILQERGLELLKRSACSFAKGPPFEKESPGQPGRLSSMLNFLHRASTCHNRNLKAGEVPPLRVPKAVALLGLGGPVGDLGPCRGCISYRVQE